MGEFVKAYLDESGSLPDEQENFVVAVLICLDERKIARIMKKARRRIASVSRKVKKLTSELKFANTSEKTRRYILESLESEDIEIYVLILDKMKRKVEDTPVNYGLIVKRLLKYCFKFHSRIDLTLDIHYTRVNKRERIIRILSYSELWDKDDIEISMADSARNKLLQLVDFVAGAFYFKYARKDDRFAKIVKRQVKQEELVKWQEIKR